MTKIFIDGREGTTGLRIDERLRDREDITLLTLPEEKRKDTEARREMLNACDIAFLCLPDAAAIEAVSLIENSSTRVIDTSTAHRTSPGWTYGFPELSADLETAVRQARFVASPGCHASGFVALVRPLIDAGLLKADALLTCHSVTGYSGGGKKMIAGYRDGERSPLLDAPRQYGLTQGHKHLPEMQKLTGLQNAPLFCPIVSDFYSGMAVTVPLFASQLQGTVEDVRRVYREKYQGPIVRFTPEAGEGGFFSAAALTGTDAMEVTVAGNEDRILLLARYDNLGKGASGAAMECMNLMMGTDPTLGLVL